MTLSDESAPALVSSRRVHVPESAPILISQRMPELLPMTGRSRGVHVSTVITDLAVRLGYLKTQDKKQPRPEGLSGQPVDARGKPYRAFTGDDVPEHDPRSAYMQLGCGLEYAEIARMEAHEPGRYMQPGEFEHDGMFLTPDLWDMIDTTVDEFKLTWMSSRHDPMGKKFWRYRAQLKAYCLTMETARGRLHVTHVNGPYDWSAEGGPQHNVWEWTYSRAELDTNWRMLKRHAKLMGDEAIERHDA